MQWSTLYCNFFVINYILNVFSTVLNINYFLTITLYSHYPIKHNQNENFILVVLEKGNPVIDI